MPIVAGLLKALAGYAGITIIVKLLVGLGVGFAVYNFTGAGFAALFEEAGNALSGVNSVSSFGFDMARVMGIEQSIRILLAGYSSGLAALAAVSVMRAIRLPGATAMGGSS